MITPTKGGLGRDTGVYLAELSAQFLSRNCTLASRHLFFYPLIWTGVVPARCSRGPSVFEGDV